MFRVCAVSVLTLGLLTAASSQAQQPGPYMDGSMQMQGGYGPQMLPPTGPYGGAPQGFDPAYAQAMYEQQMGAPYGAAPMQYQGPVQEPIIAGGPGGMMGGDCGCGCAGPCDGGCGCAPCNDCFQPCCEPCPPPGCPIVCSAEIETLFLIPELNGNLANGVLASPTVPALATFTSADADLDDELFVTPRIYLHAQKCEWGLGYRLFYLDETAAEFSPLGQLQLNILGDFYQERLSLMYSDVEVTYGWNHGQHHYGILSNSSFQLAVGVRYAELDTDSLAFGTAILDDVLATSTAVARSEFDGIGITAGFRGTKQLWHCTSGFFSVRGSVVSGDLTTRTQTVAQAVGIGDAAGAVTVAGAATNDDLMIGEFQLGVQWEHDLRCLPARYFFRVAAEYQHYNLDSPIFATSDAQVDIATVPGTIATAQSSALAKAPDLDLFGISIGTGLMW